MKAMVQSGYGGSERLRLAEIADPLPRDDEVVVAVRAAGVDAGVVHMLSGTPFPVRMAMPLRGERVLGLDVAGVVSAVGGAVTGVGVGDEVFGSAVAGAGSFAELARVRADRLAPKPPDLTFVEAAALPVSGSTALRAVEESAAVTSGERVLVLGAAGGVGHLAVQLAKAAGAVIVGAASGPKIDLVTRVGADEPVDYREEDPLVRGPFDAIIDTGGHRPLRALRRALTSRGRLILVGAEPEGAPLGGMGRSIGAALLNPFVSQRLAMLASSETTDTLARLSAHVAAGDLRPVIAAEFPLERAPDAVASIGRGSGRGKTVVTVGA